jgi:hypothetical protein
VAAGLPWSTQFASTICPMDAAKCSSASKQAGG